MGLSVRHACVTNKSIVSTTESEGHMCVERNLKLKRFPAKMGQHCDLLIYASKTSENIEQSKLS